mgnify:CR=1 FL=1
MKREYPKIIDRRKEGEVPLRDMTPREQKWVDFERSPVGETVGSFLEALAVPAVFLTLAFRTAAAKITGSGAHSNAEPENYPL